MFRCRRRKIKFLVAVVSIIGLVYVTYQVKSIQELTQKTEVIRKPVRGVHYSMIAQYNGVMGNEFVCLHDRTPISWAKINDDYCDCDDGTDEPGTDACPNGKFFCDSDIYKRHAVPLSSSRVNDGICDCCDGSDEWKKIRLPFKLPGYYSPVQPEQRVLLTESSRWCFCGVMVKYTSWVYFHFFRRQLPLIREIGMMNFHFFSLLSGLNSIFGYAYCSLQRTTFIRF